ncbi:hypothetical protein Acy02nite_66830 [Actinoplanes cyaneus]|uniref:DUF1684 domain-containing protein n=1 Tax=Actinoplanes cyaneus TaxID=52696 RepID=A0A919IP53_9ACTN|nr:DUF1684 domain-containing protein [Actinoplanes cyaneus]MCW2142834.1 hypothetical protein [Actinoplanes cyaneus]GID68802.1 hypothetical protein Acy02nite_66830 [Actinoplanes cyaneus]
MESLELADFRAAVARNYLDAADLSDFRTRRDDLFATHPQSPIPPPERAGFTGLRYYPENPAMIVDVPVREAAGELTIDTGGPDGVVRYTRAGILQTPFGELTLWWIAAYGGGLFLPVRDGTSGSTTYGGGRYLTDTVKGTHGRGVERLGSSRVRLDFNYLYNPSCAYDPRWACPLAPPENRITVAVEAGEKTYH